MNWTEGKVKSFITSVLRAGWRKWPARYETLKEAATEKKVNKKTGRMAQHYRCASCKGEFTSKDVCVDHKKPVVCPKTGFTTWDTFIKRLFCDKKNLQVLCEACHSEKTKQETAQRKKYASKESV